MIKKRLQWKSDVQNKSNYRKTMNLSEYMSREQAGWRRKWLKTDADRC